jgi:hypothetical protein
LNIKRTGLLSAFITLLAFSVGLKAQETSAGAENVSASVALQMLSRSFFEWRRSQQPVQGDDIPRVERPNGWVPDFSPDALEGYREQYFAFLEALDEIETDRLPVREQVNARLLRAAIHRVHWELDVLRAPHRNPIFYVEQTLGSVFELLIISSPMTPSRAENILLRLEHFPDTIKAAKKNLELPVRPFARATIDMLADIEARLRRMEQGLVEVFPEDMERRLRKAVGRAISSLQSYSKWLDSRLDKMRTAFAIGPNAYQWFLVNVALIPYTPDELLAQGRQAWNRSVAWDVVEKNRNEGIPELPLFKNQGQQVEAARLKEQEIRAFLESRNLMTVPKEMPHYLSRPMPDYLAPLAFMGVADDLTSETRLDENAVRYIWEPSPELSYFNLSAARDPRPLIIHEGIPGHYYQLWLSWNHPDPVRRRYIDSGVNEGIGFYVEELLLQAGLFDFSPRSREIIYSYSRLRALRVEIDIRLATGDFTIEQAAQYLERAVPMDRETALEEAIFFAFNPGQAITYQVGKLQILAFLADARLDQGDTFSLRQFHDFLMQNGNVPIALQRWEFLGRDEDVQRLDALGAAPVTVPE